MITQGTQSLVVTENSLVHERNPLDETQEISKPRIGKAYTPDQHKAVTEGMTTPHP